MQARFLKVDSCSRDSFGCVGYCAVLPVKGIAAVGNAA
jgi:hypothetical protein